MVEAGDILVGAGSAPSIDLPAKSRPLEQETGLKGPTRALEDSVKLGFMPATLFVSAPAQ